MTPKRVRDFELDTCGLIVLAPLLAAPFTTTNPLYFSLTNQIVVGIVASLAVYIMLRMNLLSFTVPTFMAVGGYTAAIISTHGATNLLFLLAGAFVMPVLIAIPLGVLVLRLKGVYFIFFTFILNEVAQVVIFETPSLTGGSNGIAGIPPVTFLAIALDQQNYLVLVTVITGIIAAAATLAVTQRFRAEFAAIDENETLAESLGVAVWKYRTVGFVASAGVAGLGGFAVVNQLSTAHPSEFTSFSAINYVAYAFVGGKGTMLGSVVGATLLILMSNYFSSQGAYASALFGLLLMSVVMVAPGGIVGEMRRLMEKRSRAQRGHRK